MILLDTNVLSETLRERPNAAVMEWFRAYPKTQFWIASIIVAELLSGIELMPEGKKKSGLRETVEAMISLDFKGRILKFDIRAARVYGMIFSHRQEIGRRVKEMDALIAATAKAHGATLATRNIADFEHCGIPLINPWDA